jgi:predicted DNA-binding ribbon-helix-helix protein
MTLFKTEDVKRYFSILEKLGRVTEAKYDGKCQKEIFVKRTLNKWFKNKDIVLYDINESGIEFLNYLHISSIHYYLGYSDEINVTVLSYNKGYQWELKKIGHNDALDLEGIWSENTEIHSKVLNLTSTLNIPIKEYVYQTYDWSLYPKRVRDEEKAKEKIKGIHSFFGRTIRSVDKQIKDFRENSKIMIGELLEIKEIDN